MVHYANLFFFLIDFEQKKPLICSFDESTEKGLIWDIQGVKISLKINRTLLCLSLIKNPFHLMNMKKDLSLFNKNYKKGNSYLLNLTYPTEIQLNADLRQIFHSVNAPYKLLFEDQFVCFSHQNLFVQIKQNKIYIYPIERTIDARQPNAKPLC